MSNYDPVIADLNRYLDEQAEGERAAEATDAAREKYATKVRTDDKLLAEEIEDYFADTGDTTAMTAILVRAYRGPLTEDDKATLAKFVTRMGERAAEREVPELTAQDLREAAEEARYCAADDEADHRRDR